MKKLIPLLSLVLLLSCKAEPESLAYGKDGCYTCKMTLMDKKFGAEIVTRKGKVYKFDDINCMLNFYNSGFEPEENILHCLIVDFSNPEKFIDAQQAWYIKSDQIKSPMASSIAAFEKQEDLDRFNKDWKGIMLSWGEVKTQFK